MLCRLTVDISYDILSDVSGKGFGWAAGLWSPWAAFALGGRQARFFEFGEFRLAILSLLSEAPKHGYQLMKEMAERSGGLYRASAGSVYPTLQQLEDEGLVEVERENGRRVYRLTRAGRRELERDPASVHRIWERAERWEDWGQYLRPEVLAAAGPVAALVRAALQAWKHAAGHPDREQRIRDILDRARRELAAVERNDRT